ncbi:glycosyltransferase, partial [bacterium]|nr:glycosyltransferase [bacterium]
MTTGRGLRLPGRTVLLIVLAALLAFAFQGSRGLYETTEGRYAESAREMLETGDWLVPRLDYEPHWTKPPLTYWALAGGMALLGENEW